MNEMKDMKGMCAKCLKREACVELCKEAEEYISQDYVAREEGIADIIIENKSEGIDWGEKVLGTPQNNKYLIYKMYFIDKMKLKDIIQYISIDESTVVRIIQYFRNENNIGEFLNSKNIYNDVNKKILKLHFIDKLKPIEIFRRLKDVDDNYIYRLINKYLVSRGGIL